MFITSTTIDSCAANEPRAPNRSPDFANKSLAAGSNRGAVFNRKTERERRGFLLTELLVAAGLLVIVMSVATSLIVKNGRLRQDARHYRLAVDELSNQLDLLTSLDEPGLQRALATLSPSPQIQDVLPNPVLSAEILSDTDGTRIVLHLSWDRPGKHRPLTLVGWVDPLPAAAVAEDSEAQP